MTYGLELFGFPLCFQCSFRYPYEGKLNSTAESTQRPKSFLTSLGTITEQISELAKLCLYVFQNATFWAFGAYGPKPSKGLHSRCRRLRLRLHSRCRNRRTPKTPLGETAQLETCRDLLTILWDLLMKQVTREGKRMMGPYNSTCKLLTQSPDP